MATNKYTENMDLPLSVLTRNQEFKTDWREYEEDGLRYRIRAILCYDDNCNNGHNSFSITADGRVINSRGNWSYAFGGCCHDKIEKQFPEYSHLIKWHLFDTTGGIFTIENAIYLASNRDYNGLLKGEPNTRLDKLFAQFNKVPLLYRNEAFGFMEWARSVPHTSWENMEIIELFDDKEPTKYSKFTVGDFPADKWFKCPFDNEEQATEFIHAMRDCEVEWVTKHTSWGKGKDRDLRGAREVAIWPEATDEQLSLPEEELKELLLARVPGLVQEFKKDMEALGFIY